MKFHNNYIYIKETRNGFLVELPSLKEDENEIQFVVEERSLENGMDLAWERTLQLLNEQASPKARRERGTI